MQIRTALISVSDKTGLGEFARSLTELGVQIVSTGGTASTLEAEGVSVTRVSKRTGFPEILDGRVKTLHPRIHAGILARHGDPAHRQILAEHDIGAIELVVVNLYPFSRTVARPNVSRQEAVEKIDIGGPTLVRAAAKNSDSVTVLVDPGDYPRVIAEMKAGKGVVPLSIRQELATKAFQHTAAYDAAIATWMENAGRPEDQLPAVLLLNLKQGATLSYGENPHQRAAVYSSGPPAGLLAAKQHQGKELSLNNLVDMDSAWGLCREFERTACCIIKHNNPCGTALGDSPAAAYRKALACDPAASFGSVIAFNRSVDEETAEEMSQLFVEVVIAPSYEATALERFSRKKNLRVIEMPPQSDGSSPLNLRSIQGGFLAQDRDACYLKADNLEVVSKIEPAEGQMKDLLFSWTVCKHVKSNAIVLVKDEQTLGIGAGQMSRVDSVELSVRKANLNLAGSVMASDAFFPFPDSIEAAADAGVGAVIQPGGSIRDQAVIEAADRHGLAMVFTGIRHFRH